VFIKVFRTPANKGTEPQGSEQKNASAASNKVNWQMPEPYPTTLRDPMQFGSITTNGPETGKITVKGIVYSKDNPSAVIADRIVHEGDKVLDATVIKINKDSVEFEMNNERWTQKVQQ
jgi:sRNA-binding protein